MTMRPYVLTIGGHDPSGGAGLHADIEAINAAGARAASCCSALTIQDTKGVYGFMATPSEALEKQVMVVLADLPITAIKTGMLATMENIALIARLAVAYPHLPIVIDPVSVSNSGHQLGTPTYHKALSELLPYATLFTPNTLELQALTGETDLAKGANKLWQMGAKNVFVKGAHAPTTRIAHHLFMDGELVYQSTWPRLAGEFRGTGCSLASFVSARIAQQQPIRTAVMDAEIWLQQTLLLCESPNVNGQHLPRRDFAAYRPNR